MPRLKVQIRWLIGRDVPEVMAIERESFAYPWTEDELINALRVRNIIGMVAEVKNDVVGYMVYEVTNENLQILSLAVDPAVRCMGVGEQLVAQMKDKLSAQRRSEIFTVVREGNLGAQLFLRAMGFRWTMTVPGCYEISEEDGYVMSFCLDAVPPWAPKNRISNYVG